MIDMPFFPLHPVPFTLFHFEMSQNMVLFGKSMNTLSFINNKKKSHGHIINNFPNLFLTLLVYCLCNAFTFIELIPYVPKLNKFIFGCYDLMLVLIFCSHFFSP